MFDDGAARTPFPRSRGARESSRPSQLGTSLRGVPSADLGLLEEDDADVEEPKTETLGEASEARLTQEKLALVLYGALDDLGRPTRERDGEDAIRWIPRRSRGRVFFLVAGASTGSMAGDPSALPGVPGVSAMVV